MRKNSTTFMALIVFIFLLSSCAQPGTSMPIVNDTQAAKELPTATATPAVTPTLPANTFFAPALPAVSAPISAANISQLTRLTSLGEGDLMSVQLSPDKKWIVLGTRNGILVMDAATLQKSYFIPTQMKPDEINFLNNGTEISALDRMHTKAGIWTFPEGKVIREVKPACHLDPTGNIEPYYTSTSQDLKYTFTYIDNVAGLCDTTDGQPVYTLNEQLTNWFLASPDEKKLVFSTSDKLVVIRFQDGQVLQEIPEAGIKSFFFYPDGGIFASVSENQIKFWSAEDYHLIDTIQGAGIQFIGFSPDHRVFSIRSGGLFRFLRAEDRQLINGINGVEIQYTEDGGGVIVSDGNGSTSVYQFSEDRSAMTLQTALAGWGVDYGTSTPGFTSDDNNQLLLVTHYGDRGNGWVTEIVIHDLVSGQKVRYEVPLGQSTELQDAVWLPEVQTFAVLLGSPFDRTGFYLLKPESKTLTRLVGGSNQTDNPAIVFSEDSNLLIYARSGVVTTWDIQNNTYTVLPGNVTTYQDLLEQSTYIHATPDQKYRVTNIELRENPGFREILAVYINGVERPELIGYSSNDLEFSPDSQMIAISTFSMLAGIHVEVFDLASGEKLFSTGEDYAEGDRAPQIAFSPDGKYFAILPEVGYPQIWGIP